MATKTNNSKRTNKKGGKHATVKMILSVHLMALVVFGIFTLMHYISMESNKVQSQDQQNINTADLLNNDDKTDSQTKTDNETKAGNDAKDRLEEDSKDQTTTKTNSDGLKVATVVINYAGKDGSTGKIVAGGTVSNLVETAGTCTYTFTGANGTVVTETSGVLPSAKSTPCEGVSVDISKFAGSTDWTVKLSYKSDYAEGESETQSFKI